MKFKLVENEEVHDHLVEHLALYIGRPIGEGERDASN